MTSIHHSLIEDLHSSILNKQALVIVGAGVSIGASGNAAVASWPGLIRDGARRCREINYRLDDAWGERVEAQICSRDIDDVLLAAELISRKLDSPHGGEFRRWLRESVGQLRPLHKETIEAIAELDTVIATTNYDGLISEVTGLPPVTWLDGSRAERILRGDERGVLHLHGYWDRPESVVLGIRSYDAILGDSHAQNFLRVLQTMKAAVFVGYGSGLADPNFGALLDWTEKTFSRSEYRRFRLALKNEAQELQEEHPPGQRLFVIPFGDELSELPGFLRQFVPPSSAADTFPRIHKLSLAANELEQVPLWVRRFTGLTNLDLSDNRIEELPSWFSELNQLRALNLRSNCLRRLPEDIEKLTSLEDLDVRDNRLETLPDSLLILTGLRYIHLEGNAALGIPDRLSSQVPRRRSKGGRSK